MFAALLCGNCCGSQTEDVRILDFSHYLLTEVPSDIYLHERTLEKLYLDSNRISELPRQLFNCDELRTLNLSDNEINFVPPAISFLINLYKLDISKNAVTTLPENIRSCIHLAILDLSVNPLEKFPESLINLISLNELYMTDVYLEFLPANFGKLVNLRILELRENNLNTLPKTMSRLIHLQRLDIGNNEYRELPEVICSLHNLTELWIDGNHIRKISPGIGQLRKMIHFDASNNNIEILPRDIGYWTRVVEFNISNNDLSSLPTTIGNMKNLVGLKLEDNQLKNLPDSIGKLTNLEELMLSHNYIGHLPTSIGLLRKLQTLIMDKNMLTSIPSELGSCTALSILSMRGNRLTEIPAEVGHLSSLRMLNLVDNHLRNLPMSLLKLDKLSALWLSTNQSQPLVPLQQDMDPETFQMILTCFMLPQLTHKKIDRSIEQESAAPRQAHHRHICFATDANITIEQPGRLTRAPTPYPKELRALAKHAKNIQRGLTVSQHKQTDKVIQPAQGPVQIKEAKVTVTPQNASNGNVPYTAQNEQPVSFYNGRSPDVANSDMSEIHAEITSNIPASDSGISTVIAFASSPVIREAKNIRTDLQSNSHNALQTSSPQSMQSTQAMQPPPYHIAAAYSLQAQFFNSYDSPLPESVNNSVSPRVPDSPTSSTLEREHDVMQMMRVDGSRLTDHDNHDSIPRDNENNELNELNADGDHRLNQIYNDRHDSQTDSPRTFIQDIPSPGQNIVIPTPKRPDDRMGYLSSVSSHNRPSAYNGNEVMTIHTSSTDFDSEAIAPLPNGSETTDPNLTYVLSAQAFPNSSGYNGNERRVVLETSNSGFEISYLQSGNLPSHPSACNGNEPSLTQNSSSGTDSGPVSARSNRPNISAYNGNETSLTIQNSSSGTDSGPVSPRLDRNLNLTNVNNHANKKNMRPKVLTPRLSNASTSTGGGSEGSTRWVFGQHKNATVVQVTVQKNPDLGILIGEKTNKGIYVEGILSGGPAGDVLRIGDKILEVEGIDFTKFTKDQALAILDSVGPTVSMMISHMD